MVLPVLLIGACLCGIFCMILMGFGGLFCYGEGKKASEKDDHGTAFYHALSRKNGNRKGDYDQVL